MKNPAHAAPLTAIGLISAAALAYEILLIRMFAIVHWHHLVATAISLALLGYGASGTLLALVGGRLRRHFAPAFIANALLFSLSSLACVHLAQLLPFDPQAMAWDPMQFVYLSATFLILAFPFLAAANCIGLALWQFRDRIPRIYGYDLIGAGLGALLLLVGLGRMLPADNLFAIFLAGILVAVAAAASQRWHPRTITLLGLSIAVAAWTWARPELQPAQYKDLSRSLAVIGASLDYRASGVTGTVSTVRNDRVPIRQAPGLSLNSAHLPPRQLAVFVDGDAAGTLPASDNARDVPPDYLHDLISSLPYSLLAMPRVALLNAGVGARVEQALALDASSVIAVEPNPLLHEMVCAHYAEAARHRCDARTDWRSQSLRSFATRTAEEFDLISLAIETDPAGVDALQTDFSWTHEALATYLKRLSAGGILTIEGPTRYPPKLVPRTLETLAVALEAHGIRNPGAHIAVIRGWQRFIVLAARTPLSPEREEQIRSFAGRLGFDLVWLPKMAPTEANRYQQLAQPSYYQAASELFGGTQATPTVSSRFRVEAHSDDIPFPNRFTRWSEWWQALCCGDSTARAQLDAGLVVGTMTLGVVTLSGLLLIILPLLLPDRRRTSGPRERLRSRTLAYFSLVGIAFLFVEIAWIQRLQLYLGHPVYATTAVLVSFLTFAGLGSLWAQSKPPTASRRLLVGATLAIALFSIAYLVFVPDWLSAAAGLPLVLRGSLALILLAPLAFAMGIPFPVGLRTLGDLSESLIPWAWGINGVASVISAAAAPLLAMEIGFSGLIVVAATAYLVLPAFHLGRHTNS